MTIKIFFNETKLLFNQKDIEPINLKLDLNDKSKIYDYYSNLRHVVDI